jgi:ElaB/YqjD/DUF883 family membrane-anchored ribosome-binding protein
MANTSTKPEEVKDKAREVGASVGQKVADVASTVGQKAQDIAANVTQKAQDAASNLGGTASEYASTAKEKADDAISAVGDKMTSLAGTIRESLPQEGYLGTASRTVADNLQAGGRYLQEHAFGDMTDDLTAVVRRYPIQSVLIGFGIGFLLSKATSRG